MTFVQPFKISIIGDFICLFVYECQPACTVCRSLSCKLILCRSEKTDLLIHGSARACEICVCFV